jgi:NTP pyrophosphatase (non-canonical NTP hydrolase)
LGAATRVFVKALRPGVTWTSDPASYCWGMNSSPSSARSITVSGFQQLIRERYFPTDSARGTPGTFMWFVEEVGELATALHDNAPGKTPTEAERANLGEEFADVFAWLCTLANINGVDLERALSKYTEPERVKGVKP